jgi:hypothetical protein
MSHPLHEAVAERIEGALSQDYELLRDPACGGEHQLPLFVGTRKAMDTRMCCADLLLLAGDRVRGIFEIEESGFLPTKICGKFLQAALADHYIHSIRKEGPVPYADRVLFIQVLDGAACLKHGGRKAQQGRLIEEAIRKLLPLRGLNDYRLFFVNGPCDDKGLNSVSTAVNDLLTKRRNSI